jgi:hypothetical protein
VSICCRARGYVEILYESTSGGDTAKEQAAVCAPWAEAADYLFEGLVVDVEIEGEEVGLFRTLLLGENWGQYLATYGKLGTVPGRADAAAIRYSPGFPRNDRLRRRRSHCGKRIDVRGGKSNEARSEMREARLQKCGDGRPQPEGRRKSSEKERTQGVEESRNPVGD